MSNFYVHLASLIGLALGIAQFILGKRNPAQGLDRAKPMRLISIILIALCLIDAVISNVGKLIFRFEFLAAALVVFILRVLLLKSEPGPETT